jgi:hypothetical protein
MPAKKRYIVVKSWKDGVKFLVRYNEAAGTAAWTVSRKEAKSYDFSSSRAADDFALQFGAEARLVKE